MMRWRRCRHRSEDVIRADEARGNAENVTLDNLTYMGSYLLSAKNHGFGLWSI